MVFKYTQLTATDSETRIVKTFGKWMCISSQEKREKNSMFSKVNARLRTKTLNPKCKKKKAQTFANNDNNNTINEWWHDKGKINCNLRLLDFNDATRAKMQSQFHLHQLPTADKDKWKSHILRAHLFRTNYDLIKYERKHSILHESCDSCYLLLHYYRMLFCCLLFSSYAAMNQFKGICFPLDLWTIFFENVLNLNAVPMIPYDHNLYTNNNM